MYKIENNKVYNEKGDVAVIVSPGYGAGWYSWNTSYPDCVFDPDCVLDILNNNKNDLKTIAESKWDGYWSVEDVEIVWIPKGTQFRIDEYDGFESIETSENLNWITA